MCGKEVCWDRVEYVTTMCVCDVGKAGDCLVCVGVGGVCV